MTVENRSDATLPGAYTARTLMLALFAFFAILVGVAAKRGRFQDVENLPEDA